MSSIAVLVTGEPIPSVLPITPDFGTLIRNAAGKDTAEWLDLDLRQPACLPDPREFAACIITGSAHCVTEPVAWMDEAKSYLRRAREAGIPLFGLCFGHQLMASAFGGQVVVNPRGREMGVFVAKSLGADGPLRWPREDFVVAMSHRDTVAALPPHARTLATTVRDANAAIHYGGLCYSTQFHPEFTPDVLRRYIEHYRDHLETQGDDVDRLLTTLRDAPRARMILRDFVELATGLDQQSARRCAS